MEKGVKEVIQILECHVLPSTVRDGILKNRIKAAGTGARGARS